METHSSINVTGFVKIMRNRTIEQEIGYASKANFAVSASRPENLQKIISGYVASGNNAFICDNNRLAIKLDTPMHPGDGNNGLIQAGCVPEIKVFDNVEYGGIVERRRYVDEVFPLLDFVGNLSGDAMLCVATGNIDPRRQIDSRYFYIARQIGPRLKITDAWNDPSVRDPNLTWQPSDIEYCEFNKAVVGGGFSHVISVSDIHGCIRHLIVFFTYCDGNCAIVPLTFAQHPNYSSPKRCFFSFQSEWWLTNSYLLTNYPDAEVIITNEIGFALFQAPNKKQIVMGFFFGPEMISHLHLECLRGRKVEILVIKSEDRTEYARNLHEAVLLKSRMKELEIDASFLVTREEICDKWLPNCFVPIRNCTYTEEDVSEEKVIAEAQTRGIQIPENLRPDRYGALTQDDGAVLVDDLLRAGCLTAVTAHVGVDLALVTCSILAGLKKKTIFPEKWTSRCEINPACFIQSNTAHRHQTFYKMLSNQPYPFYEIPCEKPDALEKRFSALVKENGFNVFIFEARQIVKEYRDTLEFACTWAQRHGIGIVIITTQVDTAAAAFFEFIASKNIHFWWTKKMKNEYIVEDRPLLIGEATAFKINFQDNGWIVQNNAISELLELEDRNITILQPDCADDSENNLKTSVYRR